MRVHLETKRQLGRGGAAHGWRRRLLRVRKSGEGLAVVHREVRIVSRAIEEWKGEEQLGFTVRGHEAPGDHHSLGQTGSESDRGDQCLYTA